MQNLRIVVQELGPFSIFEHDNTNNRSLPHGTGHKLALLLIPSSLYNSDTLLFTQINPDKLGTVKQ